MKLSGNTEKIVDMPKLASPFHREIVGNEYICIPKIEEELRWVFTQESEAVEKLDGTNVNAIVKNGQIISIYNRLNELNLWKKGSKRFVEGVLEAIEKEYVTTEKLEDGQYVGELIGPLVNGNPYQLERHLWLPLDHLRTNCRFKFWDELAGQLQGLDDKQVFDKASETFKTLWSLYKRRRGIKGDVNENTGFTGMAAEGIVFYRKGTNQMAKLRRDMFDWFKGRRHGF